MKYQLTVNEEQVRVIINALDLYERLFMGQVEQVRHHPAIFLGCPSVNQQEVECCLGRIRELAFSEIMGACHSIRSLLISDEARVAYDIQQVLSVVTGRGGVWKDVLRSSTEQELPTATKIDEQAHTDALIGSTEALLATLPEGDVLGRASLEGIRNKLKGKSE